MLTEHSAGGCVMIVIGAGYKWPRGIPRSRPISIGAGSVSDSCTV